MKNFIIWGMEITINRTEQQELELIKILKKQFFTKHYLSVLAFIIAGFLLIFSQSQVHGEKLLFWNLGSALGFGLLMISVIRIIALLKQSNSILTSITGATKISINENLITCWKTDVELKFKWSYFKFYTLKDSLIILKKDLSNRQTLIINKNDLSEQELSTLNNLFLNNRIVKQ